MGHDVDAIELVGDQASDDLALAPLGLAYGRVGIRADAHADGLREARVGDERAEGAEDVDGGDNAAVVVLAGVLGEFADQVLDRTGGALVGLRLGRVVEVDVRAAGHTFSATALSSTLVE